MEPRRQGRGRGLGVAVEECRVQGHGRGLPGPHGLVDNSPPSPRRFIEKSGRMDRHGGSLDRESEEELGIWGGSWAHGEGQGPAWGLSMGCVGEPPLACPGRLFLGPSRRGAAPRTRQLTPVPGGASPRREVTRDPALRPLPRGDSFLPQRPQQRQHRARVVSGCGHQLAGSPFPQGPAGLGSVEGSEEGVARSGGDKGAILPPAPRADLWPH